MSLPVNEWGDALVPEELDDASLLEIAMLAGRLPYDIGVEIATQDNRSTSHVVFQVQTRRRVFDVSAEYSTGRVDVDRATGEEVSPYDLASPRHTPEYDAKYRQVYYWDDWDTVRSFFTKKGADEYAAVNAHNLGEHRVYVNSGHGADEWIYLRRWLVHAGPSVVRKMAVELLRLRHEKTGEF